MSWSGAVFVVVLFCGFCVLTIWWICSLWTTFCDQARWVWNGLGNEVHNGKMFWRTGGAKTRCYAEASFACSSLHRNLRCLCIVFYEDLTAEGFRIRVHSEGLGLSAKLLRSFSLPVIRYCAIIFTGYMMNQPWRSWSYFGYLGVVCVLYIEELVSVDSDMITQQSFSAFYYICFPE